MRIKSQKEMDFLLLSKKKNIKSLRETHWPLLPINEKTNLINTA